MRGALTCAASEQIPWLYDAGMAIIEKANRDTEAAVVAAGWVVDSSSYRARNDMRRFEALRR